MSSLFLIIPLSIIAYFALGWIVMTLAFRYDWLECWGWWGDQMVFAWCVWPAVVFAAFFVFMGDKMRDYSDWVRQLGKK